MFEFFEAHTHANKTSKQLLSEILESLESLEKEHFNKLSEKSLVDLSKIVEKIENLKTKIAHKIN